MNSIKRPLQLPLAATAGLATALMLAACAPEAVKDPGAAQARLALSDLQANPNLANRAPLEIHDADAAVTRAEVPQTDPVIGQHLVYLADRRVMIAKAQAQTRFAEDQRKTLSERNGQMQLEARTHEADSAKRLNGELMFQTDLANRESAAANRRTEDVAAQLAALQAKKTDRGMVMTLGDLLFTTGRSDLKPGGTANLDRLVTFLTSAPDRKVRIEGHTDSRGSEGSNTALSQRRANSVSLYLSGHGIADSRLSSFGEGENVPIADNNTEAGRQANRRVEIIIDEPGAGSGSPGMR